MDMQKLTIKQTDEGHIIIDPVGHLDITFLENCAEVVAGLMSSTQTKLDWEAARSGLPENEGSNSMTANSNDMYNLYSLCLSHEEIEMLKKSVSTAYGDDAALARKLTVVSRAPCPTYFVTTYTVDRAYGGPEEGGWYYDAIELQDCTPFACLDEAADFASKHIEELLCICYIPSSSEIQCTRLYSAEKVVDRSFSYTFRAADNQDFMVAIEFAPGLLQTTHGPQYS